MNVIGLARLKDGSLSGSALPKPVKEGWLNLPFFVGRNIFWLVLIYAVSWWFVKTSIKPDIALARKLLGSEWGGAFADKMLNGYGEHEDEVIRLEKLSRKIAPALAIIYAVGASFLAWDFVMTLDQEWFSTLFGIFFLIGNMHAFLGLMLVTSVAVRKKFKIGTKRVNKTIQFRCK